MKYTKQDLIDGKIAIEYNHKYHKEIEKLLRACFPNHNNRTFEGAFKYYFKSVENGNWTMTDDLSNLSIHYIPVTYDQIDQFELPEKWYVIPNTLEQTLDVCRWFDKSKFANKKNPDFYENIHTQYIGSALGGIGEGNVLCNRENVGLTQITIEQFYKYVLKKDLVYTIKDLAEGKVCLFTDGCNKEQLQKVLKAAHKEISDCYGSYPDVKYYWMEENYYWNNSTTNSSKLPEQSVKEFLNELNKNEETKNMSKEKKFVTVIDEGKAYTTHYLAEAYGCTKYHYTEGLPSARKGAVLEVVKEVLVNNDTLSYILKDQQGIEYLIGKEGVEDYLDAFTLPDKWALKCNGKEEVGTWYNLQSGQRCYVGFAIKNEGYFHSYNWADQSIMNKGMLEASFHDYSKRSEYTEITFDQFKKYVMKDFFDLPDNWFIYYQNRQEFDVLNKFIRDSTNGSGYGYADPNDGIPRGFSYTKSSNHFDWLGIFTKEENLKSHKQITFEQFQKYVLKQEPTFVMPSKWCLNGGPDLVVWIKKWEADNNRSLSVHGNAFSSIYYPRDFSDISTLDYFEGSSVPEGFTLITFEQFNEYYKQKTMNTNEDKTLIGYKCPTDLFNGAIKKNTIYVVDSVSKYRPDHTSSFTIPKEIVETWEPVYKEKPIVVAKKVVTFEKAGKFIKIGCKQITLAELKHCEEVLKLQRYVNSGVKNVISFTSPDDEDETFDLDIEICQKFIKMIE